MHQAQYAVRVLFGRIHCTHVRTYICVCVYAYSLYCSTYAHTKTDVYGINKSKRTCVCVCVYDNIYVRIGHIVVVVPIVYEGEEKVHSACYVRTSYTLTHAVHCVKPGAPDIGIRLFSINP